MDHHQRQLVLRTGRGADPDQRGVLAVSRYGDIKLGPDHSRPDYRNTTWFAMLFSAGMGIGLMFFGVAEPVMHFTTHR